MIPACEKNPEKAGITDIDGNVYNTVVIGTQVWMAENLRTTHLKDGAEIPLVESDTAWANLRTPGYCWYGNYEAFFSLNHYGALYNFYAVSTGKLCPVGWHVPDTDEWYTLIMYLGDEIAGGKMKKTGTLDWLQPNTGATNESGFNALPGGFRNAYYNDFQRFRVSGHFWHSNHSDVMRVEYNFTDVIHGTLQQNDGASVRCVRD
ncbi:MAG: fibrobacter succinogenes major paralogous domain-containing protein [Bacteroidales bacterium]